MKKLLALAAGGEAATGLLLLLYPPILARLLFGAEIVGAGIFACRIAGSSLIALAIACWPAGNPRQWFYAMFTYSTLAMLCLAYAGFVGEVGILLWPAVAIHGALSFLLVWAWQKGKKPSSANVDAA